MSILSDEFYYQPVQIDTINARVYVDLVAKEGDVNGRGLLVTLTENGLTKDTTGIALNLKWEHTSVGNQGLDNFESVDLSKGLYKITYPSEMLNRGTVRASIQISDSGKFAGIRNIIITIDSGVGDDNVIVSSDSFTALAQALIDVNNLEKTYAPELLSVKQQLVTTDSRISNIIASAGDGTIPSELSDIRVGNDGELYVSAGDFTRAASEGRVPKTPIDCLELYKHPSSTSISVVTPHVYNGRTIGMAWNLQLPETAYYVYARTRIANKLYADLKTKKLRVTLRCDKDATIEIRVANGAVWGSEDGTRGFIEYAELTLNASNKWEASKVFDISSSIYASFYANPLRAAAQYQELDMLIAMNHLFKNPIGDYAISYEISEVVSDQYEDLTVARHVASSDYATSAGSAVSATSLEGFSVSEYNDIVSDLYAGLGLLALPKTVLTYSGSIPTFDVFSNTVSGLLTRVTRPEIPNPDGIWSYGLVSVHLGTFADLADKLTYVHFDDLLSTLKFRMEPLITKSSMNWSSHITLPTHSNGDYYGVYTPETLYDVIVANGNWAPTDPVYLCFTYDHAIGTSGTVIPPVDVTMSVLSTTISDYATKTSLRVSDLLSGFDAGKYVLAEDLQQAIEDAGKYVLAEDLQQAIEDALSSADYITCWGDSLTAGGGWASIIGTLSGKTVYNGGTGGENAPTIVARQGADVMVVNNITIPADNTTQLVIASKNVDGGITTAFGKKVTPLLQGGAHVNPCMIDGILGTLRWTGSSHSDPLGTWTFQRTTAGTEKVITRPTALTTDFDRNRNAGIQIIFIGQNGGYADNADLINTHKLMMAHNTAKATIILGLSSGSAASRLDYETAMRKEFGRYFISLREYLAAPIYDVDGTTIISCYGLSDAGLTPTQADLTAIATGTVPPQLLSDGVHYTTTTDTVIGNMVYKKMVELNVF